MRVSVGIVHHQTYEYLDACLESLKKQTLQPVEVRVADNCPQSAELARIAASYPEVDFVANDSNLGFAAAANELIRRSSPGTDVLILNADTKLSESFIEALAGFDADPRAGILGGMLLREDGQVDSLGIGLRRNGRAFDRRPPIWLAPEEPFEVFAISGAAIYFRRELLEDLDAVEGEWFDSSYWMYHEDLDIAWRARWRDWTCWTVPAAVAEHRRGWREGDRSKVARDVRRHSFKNHYLCLAKNAPVSMLARNAPWLMAREGLRAGYALLREWDVLPAYAMAARCLPTAWRKRRQLAAGRRIAPRRFDSWIE